MLGFGKEDKIEKRIDAIAVRARACLGHDEFAAYREEYERAERETIGELLIEAVKVSEMSDVKLAAFGARCLVKLNRLRDARKFLVRVTLESKRGE